MYFLLSMALGALLNFSQNLCAIVNSPITTSISGHLKDIILTFISFTYFSDSVPSFWLVAGLIISFCGVFIYCYTQLINHISLNKKKIE